MSDPVMPDDRLSDDEHLDEALEETFPASDPPANTVETGIQPPDEENLSRTPDDQHDETTLGWRRP
jgi:hypothetical protein